MIHIWRGILDKKRNISGKATNDSLWYSNAKLPTANFPLLFWRMQNLLSSLQLKKVYLKFFLEFSSVFWGKKKMNLDLSTGDEFT